MIILKNYLLPADKFVVVQDIFFIQSIDIEKAFLCPGIAKFVLDKIITVFSFNGLKSKKFKAHNMYMKKTISF